MLRILIIVVFFIYSNICYADFFIWHDEDGIKHISTHTPTCQQNGTFNYYQCSPLTLSLERTKVVAIQMKHRDAFELEEISQKECMAIKRRRDSIVKEAEAYLESIRSGKIPISEMVTAPIRTAQMKEKIFAAEKEYDKCFQEEERQRRKEARNKIRMQIAEDTQRLKQKRTLDSIKDDIGDIKRGLRIPY